jgi:hypothetical protein
MVGLNGFGQSIADFLQRIPDANWVHYEFGRCLRLGLFVTSLNRSRGQLRKPRDPRATSGMTVRVPAQIRAGRACIIEDCYYWWAENHRRGLSLIPEAG